MSSSPRFARITSVSEDEDLVLDIWSGLRLLARHARDRAAAGGPATVRATIWPVTPDLPAELRNPRSHFVVGGTLGSHLLTALQVTSVFDVDDLPKTGQL